MPAESAVFSPANGKVAIIDIGSNSVRLVVYSRLMRAPMAVLNEKAQCQLGKDMMQTGRLSPEGAKQAMRAFERFTMLLDVMQVQQLDVLATAAVRDAQDGPDFVAQIEQQFGWKVNILSGTEEAQLGAEAIIESMDDPDGLSCDLGGGSLELVHIRNEKARGEPVSLPLGVLRLAEECPHADNPARAAKPYISEHFKAQKPLIETMQGKTLYAIGGSFRALAKAYMAKEDYPLNVIHHYAVPAHDMRSFASMLTKASNNELSAMRGIPSKRLDTLPYAAQLMKQLIKRGQPEQVVFSTHGIREGMLLRRLDDERRAEDPLIAGALELTELYRGNAAFAELLFTWMQPLFAGESRGQRRARQAACLLLSIPRYEISPFQADAAFYQVLKAPLTGMDHPTRFMLALIAYHRYQYVLDVPLEGWESLHAPAQALSYARLVGAAADLAFSLSGGLPDVLSLTSLHCEGEEITITANNTVVLASESAAKRLERLTRAWQVWDGR